MLVIQAKCNAADGADIVVIDMKESDVIKNISSILQFTANEFKPAFDALSVICGSNCTIDNLIKETEKMFRDDIAIWIRARLLQLKQFVLPDKIVLPRCLANYDELAKRLVIGLLYAIRRHLAMPLIVDDMLAFVTNQQYSEAFWAMMRPYIFALNRYLDTREILQFNPVVIAPGGAGGLYRLARPNEYVVLFDGRRYTIPLDNILDIVVS